jgi:FtsX-like permease family
MSTLLHLLGGLDRPSGGEVRLAGNRVDQMSERALARLREDSVGFVFQAFHLMDEPTGNLDSAATLEVLRLFESLHAAGRAVLGAANALARALGATPRNVAAGLTAAQLLPALPGTLFGIPLGIGLFAAADHGGLITLPPAWWLAAAVVATLAAVAGLAAVPARVGARRPTAEILQAETA